MNDLARIVLVPDEPEGHGKGAPLVTLDESSKRTHVSCLRLRDERTVFLRFFRPFLRTVGRRSGRAIHLGGRRGGRGRRRARTRRGLRDLILCALGVGLSAHRTTVAVWPGMSRLAPGRRLEGRVGALAGRRLPRSPPLLGRPRVAEADGSIEDERTGPGLGIDAEVADPLELHALSHRGRCQRRLDEGAPLDRRANRG